MKIRKWLALSLTLILTVTILSGCNAADVSSDKSESDAPPATDTPVIQPPSNDSLSDQDTYRVLCLLNGTLGDNGFYDNMATGLNRLQSEMGWDVKIIEMGKNETGYESYFMENSECGEWDLIIASTFSVKKLLEQVAVQFPAQKYMILDVSVDFSVVTSNNVMGVTHMSNEAGFLGGALAALMLHESGSEKIDAAKPILGYVGSMDAPHINDFLIGYIEGIRYVSPDTKLLTDYVGSFADAPKCLEITKQMYRQGAQIIYAPASQSILGAVQASADANKLFVACDNDIWTASVDTDPELVTNILSSTMKYVGNAVFDAAKGLKEGDYHVGENYVLGVEAGAVGLADNENYQALVPQSIRDRMTEITKKIASGEIVVGTAFGMDPQDVIALRDSMKP